MKKGLIWVETVVYTLIGLTILAIVLSLALPQIETIKDRALVNQMADVLRLVDEKIDDASQAAGNVRVIDLTLQKGTFTIDSTLETITFTLDDTRLTLSEPGLEIAEGSLFLRTDPFGSRYNVHVWSNYSSSLNITVAGEDQNRVLTSGSAGYTLQIEHLPTPFGEPARININVVS